MTQRIADLVLLTHVTFVAFVVVGFILIVWGGLRKWAWIRNPWFRLLHLAAIGIVVIQAWCGAVCPLTRWENTLRRQSGGAVYEESFIAHWLGRILYYDFPGWVFVLVYTMFGLMVLASWFLFRPEPLRYSSRNE